MSNCLLDNYMDSSALLVLGIFEFFVTKVALEDFILVLFHDMIDGAVIKLETLFTDWAKVEEAVVRS